MHRLGQPDYRRLGVGGVPWGLGQLSLKYARKVLSVERASIISYLPLSEQAGSVAYDLSGNGFNGASVGVTLGEPGMGDGRTSYGFDGALDYVNWFSAGMAAAFNGAEGTLGPIWIKFPAAAWTDGVLRNVIRLTGDANNAIFILKHSTPNLLSLRFFGNGTSYQFDVSSISDVNFMSLTISWSLAENYVKGWRNGVQVGVASVHPTWTAPSLSATGTVIGAQNTTPSAPHLGNIQHVPLRNKALTPAQIAYLSKP